MSILVYSEIKLISFINYYYSVYRKNNIKRKNSEVKGSGIFSKRFFIYTAQYE